jgi:gamma-glutamyl-gamma-aminobutyrate hydrolase PuuD
MKIAIPVWKSSDGLRYNINVAYINYMQEAGYTPVIIVAENVGEIEQCDGLLLPGGIDIDPIYYSEENIGSYGTDLEKDEFERQLLFSFIEAGKPIFGICRGFQLIAREFILAHPKAEKFVAFFQHVNEHNGPSSYKVKRSQAVHHVYSDPTMWGSKNENPIQYPVNSMHHQALIVLDIGNTFKTVEQKLYIAATTQYGLSSEMAVKNKHAIVEGIIVNWGDSRIVAVQWHPEEMADHALLHGCFGHDKKMKGKKGKKRGV